jgi:single-strand DNA-binding protein
MANNTVTLVGNLADAPQPFTDKNGKISYRLRLATTDSYKDESGAWKQKEAVWHTVFLFALGVQKHAAIYGKGHRVKIIASLSYQDKKAVDEDGEPRTFREAILIASRIEPAPLTPKDDGEV